MTIKGLQYYMVHQLLKQTFIDGFGKWTFQPKSYNVKLLLKLRFVN